MATNEVLRKYGTSFIFADVTDFPNSGVGPSTTAANDIRIGSTSGATVAQLDLTVLAASGGARESDKVDLGATSKGHRWMVNACLEHVATPALGGVVEFWWAASENATAASGNPGGLTGSDAGFTDDVGILGQMTFIGFLPMRVNIINIGYVGEFTPPTRYGILVVINKDAATMFAAAAGDETHIIMTELIDDIQAAA